MKKVNIDRRERKALRHKRLTKYLADIQNTKPRLIVTKTNANIYAQIIDDSTSTSLVYKSSLQLKKPGTIETAKLIGEMIGEEAVKKGITQVVFDRNGQKYHGQLKVLAEAVRAKGIIL
ncbi:MAG: 50S ribosomal protein L18 [Mycoplasmataceae bacterium]|jgi:large subunit ribosomal protein L18|nr:50S ribosomal protein L18 [Mycoplasmataceae bacterium]